MFNKPKMIDRSTYLKLPTKPFLLVLLKRVLCSRCGLSSDKLPTENGKNELKLFLGGLFLFYITLVSFSIPKTAPIANAPATTFLSGVQTNGVLPDFVEDEDVGELAPVYSFTKKSAIGYVLPSTTVSIVTMGGRFGSPALIDFFTPSIISPVLNDFTIVPPVAPPDVIEMLPVRIVYGCKKINFAITNFFSMVLDKYTHNFLTFYSFAKTDRAWAKSFNSFLLPLKFIRSGKVAMEHNEEQWERVSVELTEEAARTAMFRFSSFLSHERYRVVDYSGKVIFTIKW
ncbi:MAG: hypothetical protein QG594_866, partial [Bacteroidota bacterium]|nr:hypothetical protein [Bacteroidota bacterium]